MEQLLAGAKYEFKSFKRGQTITGKVSEIKGKVIYLDIGGKAEGMLGDKEYEYSHDYIKALKIGDEVSAVVISQENDSGQVILSLKRAANESRWKLFEKALASGDTLEVKGKEINKGGLLVEIEGVYGFIPSSQFSKEFSEDVDDLVGQTVKVKVIEVDREQNRLVMSEKAVTEAVEIEARKKAMSVVKVGETYKGKVAGVVPFGAFVEITVKKNVLEGLVHISELSWEKIDDVAKILKEGDSISVMVIGTDESTGKLALSLKRLSDDPWKNIVKAYPVDSKHAGAVTKIAPYGVFVHIDKGIEGLIHASKMPIDTAFKEGDKVNVFVESVDPDKRRLSLGVVLTAKPVAYK